MFRQVQLSANSACALDDEGHLTCWGEDPYGVNRPPDGVFASYSVGLDVGCALTPEGVVACWGESASIADAVGSGVVLTQISAGYHTLCGITDLGEVACWGEDIDGNDTPPAGTFTAVATEQGLSCAVDASGTAQCWGGENAYGELDPRTETFRSISVGLHGVCGVTSDESAVCWGLENHNLPGNYSSVHDGYTTACGLSTSGMVVCSGSLSGSWDGYVAFGVFSDVACGVTAAGRVECWAREGYTGGTAILCPPS